MADHENHKWIQGAIKKPGALRKALKKKEGEKITEEELETASHKPGKMGKRARLADTLRKMSKGKHMMMSEKEHKKMM